MPPLHPIARDLHVNRLRGIGRRPLDGLIDVAHQSRKLNKFCRVREAAGLVTFSYGDSPDYKLNMDLAGTYDVPDYRTAHGFYLYYAPGWSTVATLTRAHCAVAAGGFSGCLYSVYKAGNGEYKCVHTDRPGNEYSEAFVKGIHSYAERMRWQLLYEVPTAGLQGVNGCTAVWFVSQVDYTIQPEPIVWTVRLQLDKANLSVARDIYPQVSASTWTY